MTEFFIEKYTENGKEIDKKRTELYALFFVISSVLLDIFAFPETRTEIRS